jgi:hypothetical protein
MFAGFQVQSKSYEVFIFHPGMLAGRVMESEICSLSSSFALIKYDSLPSAWPMYVTENWSALADLLSR